MRLWTVLAVGNGFIHSGRSASFELYGVVQAVDPDAAFSKAVALASQLWPELDPAESTLGSKPIDVEEINEIELVPGMEVDVVDVSWTHK
jgi:hypothetical protein